MMASMTVCVALCVDICLCFSHFPNTSEGGNHSNKNNNIKNK